MRSQLQTKSFPIGEGNKIKNKVKEKKARKHCSSILFSIYFKRFSGSFKIDEEKIDF